MSRVTNSWCMWHSIVKQIFPNSMYGKLGVITWLLFHDLIRKNYNQYTYFDLKVWIVVDFYTLMKKCHKITFLAKIAVKKVTIPSQNGKNKFTKMGLEKARFFFHLISHCLRFSNFSKSHFFRLHHQNKDYNTTSRGVLNPRPGLHVQRASAFLRPPLRLPKTEACFWKALSVYPVTIGEKNEMKKKGRKAND